MVDVYPTIYRPATEERAPRKELFSLFQPPLFQSPRSPRNNLYKGHLAWSQIPAQPELGWSTAAPLITPHLLPTSSAIPSPGIDTNFRASGVAQGMSSFESMQGPLPPTAYLPPRASSPLFEADAVNLDGLHFAITDSPHVLPLPAHSHNAHDQVLPQWRQNMPALEREYLANLNDFARADHTEKLYQAVSEERERLNHAAQREQEARSAAQREALMAMVQKREDEIGIFTNQTCCFTEHSLCAVLFA
jgi:hypothetical protein